MTVHYRAQCEFQLDTLEPKDVIAINPCFRDQGASSNPDGLATDLLALLNTWQQRGAPGIRVKLYDLQGTKPVYPAAEKKNAAWGGAPVSSNVVREVALCLSFYGTQNVKRHRGRLYIPLTLFGSAPSTYATATMMTKVMSLGPLFAALGGVDVDWIVWSKLDNAARKVEHYWCDDSWDTVRSRGLKSSTRQTATTSG